MIPKIEVDSSWTSRGTDSSGTTQAKLGLLPCAWICTTAVSLPSPPRMKSTRSAFWMIGELEQKVPPQASAAW